jgi:hypothetical protein
MNFDEISWLYGTPLARSHDATLIADTKFLATPATRDELSLASLELFFRILLVADLSTHLFSLCPQATERRGVETTRSQMPYSVTPLAKRQVGKPPISSPSRNALKVEFFFSAL